MKEPTMYIQPPRMTYYRLGMTRFPWNMVTALQVLGLRISQLIARTFAQ
jgi:hypothetical protein